MPVPDMPADKDELGFDRFAIPLARSIAATDRHTTPWTIGVYGEWGSGKTTFLKLVERELRVNGVHPIWFNAWKYVREENLWAALIEKILTDARKSVRWYRRLDVGMRIWWRSIDFKTGAWELLRKLFVLGFRIVMVALLVLMALSLVPVAGNPVAGSLAGNPVLGEFWARVLIGVVAALGSKPDALMKVFDIRLGADLTAFRRRRAHRDQTALLDDFNAEFQGLLQVMYRKKPLVVIIDDLDRCLPEQTLQIVETVKLFLDEPGCVFLLAVDREIIEHAIRVKYKDLPAAGDVGETYFEKVVQLPYSLPPPAESMVESYIKSISEDEDVRACLPILRGTSPYNPRRIKRSVQAFTLLKGLAADIAPVSAVLAKLVVIQAQFRRVYRAAVNDHSLLARLEVAYREPGTLEGETDLVFAEQVKQYTETYPALGELLRHSTSEADSFQRVQLVRYLSFVDTVASAEPVEPRRVSARRDSELVMHLPEDARWGQWLRGHLVKLRRRSITATPETAADIDLKDFDHAIAIVSSASVASVEAQRQWAAAIASGTRFIGVVVEDCELPEVLDGRHVVKVVGLDESEARSVLDNALRPATVVTNEVSGLSGTVVQVGDVVGDLHIYPGRGSAINNVPLLKPNLVERAGLLHGIDQVLRPAFTGACALVGMPGSGKTVLAQQYAEANASRYEVIWWIRADQFDTDLAAFARALDVSVDQVPSRVATFGRCLVVFDGANDPEKSADLLRQLGSVQILVTSRHRDWANLADVVVVDVFSPEESLSLLGSFDGSAQLAAGVGHLPAALAAALSYLRDTKTTGTNLADLVRDSPNPVTRTLGIAHALDVVAAGRPEVLRLIGALGLLGPTWIPRDLLLTLTGEHQLTLDRMLALLYTNSLIELGTHSVSLHPSVRQAIIEYTGDRSDLTGLVASVVHRGANHLQRARDAESAAALLPALAVGDLTRTPVGVPELRSSIELAASASCVVIAGLGSDTGLPRRICAELDGVAGGTVYTYAWGDHLYLHRDGTDAVTHLVTAPLRPDCVFYVETDVGRDGLGPQVAVARNVGVRTAVVVGSAPPALGGFPQILRAQDWESAVDQLNAVQRSAASTPVGLSDRIVVLVIRRDAMVDVGYVSLRGETRSAQVVSFDDSGDPHTRTLVLVLDEPMSVAKFDRFQSVEYGNGVITRIVK